MSEKRLTIFPKNIDAQFPEEATLVRVLTAGGFIEPDRGRPGSHELTPAFMSLLDQSEVIIPADESICVWLEYHEKMQIQMGADSQDLEAVRTPDGSAVLGDLDLAYELATLLAEDIEAEYEDPATGITYKIRELDFEHYMGYGHTFIHVDRYFNPTPEFMRRLTGILNVEIGYCMYWL